MSENDNEPSMNDYLQRHINKANEQLVEQVYERAKGWVEEYFEVADIEDLDEQQIDQFEEWYNDEFAFKGLYDYGFEQVLRDLRNEDE